MFLRMLSNSSPRGATAQMTKTGIWLSLTKYDRTTRMSAELLIYIHHILVFKKAGLSL
jgi:hypothetical protein